MTKMHDIIWSLETEKHKNSLEDVLKSYAMNMLTNQSIPVSIIISKAVEENLNSPKVRQNVLMILKEIMNNCAKHSGATHFSLNADLKNRDLVFEIEDNGKGFDADKAALGNGLSNIAKRLKELNGDFILKTIPHFDGTHYTIRIPVKRKL